MTSHTYGRKSDICDEGEGMLRNVTSQLSRKMLYSTWD